MNIRELASSLGVSPATVSIVLNEKSGVSDETREKVLSAIRETGYVPAVKRRKAPRSAALVKCMREGVLTEENQGFIATIIDAAAAELAKYNYSLTMVPLQVGADLPVDQISFDNFEGAIVIATEIPRDLYGSLEQLPVPFVCVDNPMPGCQYSCVAIDNEENVRLALEYVKKCGYTHVGYLKSAFEAENFTARSRAFYHYCGQMGLETGKADVIPLRATMMGAFEDMKSYLDEGKRDGQGKRLLPPCFFADNDTIALGAMKALKHRGYELPRDTAIIGFDDIPFSAVNSPSLTTVHVPRELIGKISARQLMAALRDPEQNHVKVAVSGDLIVRSTLREN